MKMSVWWHHAFLRRKRSTSEMILDISKAWIHGLSKDVQEDKIVPKDFRLTAIFTDLDAKVRKARDQLIPDEQRKSMVRIRSVPSERPISPQPWDDGDLEVFTDE